MAHSVPVITAASITGLTGLESRPVYFLKLNGAAILSNFNQYMGSNTRVLSPNVVTETRFGFTQFYNTTGPQLAFSRDGPPEPRVLKFHRPAKGGAA